MVRAKLMLLLKMFPYPETVFFPFLLLAHYTKKYEQIKLKKKLLVNSRHFDFFHQLLLKTSNDIIAACHRCSREDNVRQTTTLWKLGLTVLKSCCKRPEKQYHRHSFYISFEVSKSPVSTRSSKKLIPNTIFLGWQARNRTYVPNHLFSYF